MILESLNKKQKIIFFIILSIMILFIIYYIYLSVYKNESNFIISTENTMVEDNFVENNYKLPYAYSADVSFRRTERIFVF